MANLFTRLPFTVSRTDLPVVDLAAAVPVFGAGFEDSAKAHWLFGASQGLGDLIANQALTPQAAGATYADSYVTLPGGGGKALLTPFDDAAVQAICMVIRTPATPVDTVYAGSLTPTASEGGSGFFSFGSPAGVRGNSRPAGQTTQTNFPTDGGKWVFIGFSEVGGVNPGRRVLYVGGAAPYTDSPTQIKQLAGRKVAIGNAYYANLFPGSVDTAEFIYFQSELTIASFDGIYARSKQRLATRGITIF